MRDYEQNCGRCGDSPVKTTHDFYDYLCFVCDLEIKSIKMKKPKKRKVSLMFSDDYHQITFIEVMAEITITQGLDGLVLSMPQYQAEALTKEVQEKQSPASWDFEVPYLVQVLMAYQDGMSSLPSIYNVELVERRDKNLTGIYALDNEKNEDKEIL
jgi:hypothetical protein